jgi:hypothetical protein
VSTTSETLSSASQWLHHSLSGRLFASQQFYANHSAEDAYTLGAEGSVRLDLSADSSLRVDGAFAQRPQLRATPEADANATGRAIYNTASGAVSYSWRRDKWTNRAEVEIRKTAYTSQHDASRSGTQYVYSDRVGRDLLGYLNLFIDGAYAQHDWLRRGDLRNFDLLTGLVGGRFQIPSIFDAEIGVGVMRQDFTHAAFRTLVTPTFAFEMTWNVMPLTSIIVSGDRTVVGTETFCGGLPSACAAGTVTPDQRNTRETTTALAGVQHEFRHDFLAEARFRYERDKFDFNGLVDDTFSLNLNARYLINRHWEADMEFAHNVRTANLPNDRTYNTGPYTENVVSLTLKAAL